MKDRKRRAMLFVMLVVILVLTMTWVGLASADVGDTEWLTDESPLATPRPRFCSEKWCDEGIPTRTPTVMAPAPGLGDYWVPLPPRQWPGKALGRYKLKRK